MSSGSLRKAHEHLRKGEYSVLVAKPSSVEIVGIVTRNDLMPGVLSATLTYKREQLKAEHKEMKRQRSKQVVNPGIENSSAKIHDEAHTTRTAHSHVRQTGETGDEADTHPQTGEDDGSFMADKQLNLDELEMMDFGATETEDCTDEAITFRQFPPRSQRSPRIPKSIDNFAPFEPRFYGLLYECIFDTDHSPTPTQQLQNKRQSSLWKQLSCTHPNEQETSDGPGSVRSLQSGNESPLDSSLSRRYTMSRAPSDFRKFAAT